MHMTLQQASASNGSEIEGAQEEIATLRDQGEEDTGKLKEISREVQGSLDTLRDQDAAPE